MHGATPQVILFGSAADRRHMGLRDKLEVVSRQIGKVGLPYPMVSVIINLKLKPDVRTVEASYAEIKIGMILEIKYKILFRMQEIQRISDN